MGKNKYIETPERMWELFEQYREDIKKTPITKKDWVGGMAKEVTREMERPLTLEGFSVWCFKNSITSNIHDYFGNKNGAYTDYSDICSRIKEVIRTDQIEGGMAGIYNPSITQRLNGLTEKTESQNNNAHSGTVSLNITVQDTGVPLASNEKEIK